LEDAIWSLGLWEAFLVHSLLGQEFKGIYLYSNKIPQVERPFYGPKPRFFAQQYSCF